MKLALLFAFCACASSMSLPDKPTTFVRRVGRTNLVSQPVGTVQLLEVQQPAVLPLNSVARAAPNTYYIVNQDQQQQRTAATAFAAPVGYYVQQQQDVRTQEVAAPVEVQEVRSAATGYGAATEVRSAAPVYTAATEVQEVRSVGTGYAAAAESRAAPVSTGYTAVRSQPEEEEEEEDAEVQESRAVNTVVQQQQQPRTVYLVQESRAQEQPTQQYARVLVQPNSAAATRTNAEPNVAILSYSLNAPGAPGGEQTFDYAFEAENGIKSEAVGEMRTVGDADVMVMRGSYEYVGDDGETYSVDWYADESGFHPTARHLPQPVEIPFPEQKAAVEAQLRFAAQERASAAAASTNYGAAVAAPSAVVEARQLPSYGDAAEVRALPDYSEASEVVEVREIPQNQYGRFFLI